MPLGNLELTKCTNIYPHVYQIREVPQAIICKAHGRRFCRVCNNKINKGEKFLKADSHLSSGRISDINICKDCLLKLAKEIQQ